MSSYWMSSGSHVRNSNHDRRMCSCSLSNPLVEEDCLTYGIHRPPPNFHHPLLSMLHMYYPPPVIPHTISIAHHPFSTTRSPLWTECKRVLVHPWTSQRNMADPAEGERPVMEGGRRRETKRREGIRGTGKKVKFGEAERCVSDSLSTTSPITYVHVHVLVASVCSVAGMRANAPFLWEDFCADSRLSPPIQIQMQSANYT